MSRIFSRQRPAGQVVFQNHVHAQAILEQWTRAVEAAVVLSDHGATDRLLRGKYRALKRYHLTGQLRALSPRRAGRGR